MVNGNEPYESSQVAAERHPADTASFTGYDPDAPAPPMPLELDGDDAFFGGFLEDSVVDELSSIAGGDQVVVPDRDYSDPEGAIRGLLEAVSSSGASDLHLIAGARALARSNGELEPLPGWPAPGGVDIERMVSTILTEEQQDRLRRERELDAGVSLPEAGRFRVTLYVQQGSLAAAFRVVPEVIPSVEELGLPKAVAGLARIRRGLVVVTGPAGSGRSTTLTAMVDVVNSERRAHILTIERPVEYLHSHRRSAVSQREVGPDTDSFAEAVRRALHQDPDVIVVGQMRDPEAIAAALDAAESGCLVLAQMHTQDATQTVDRIIDMFPDGQRQRVRVQLSLTLRGVVAQQLVPTTEADERVPAVEVLVGTGAVRNLIREGKTHQLYSAVQAGRKFGMVTMDAALAGLVADERISEATAFHHSPNPEELSRIMGVQPTSSNW